MNKWISIFRQKSWIKWGSLIAHTHGSKGATEADSHIHPCCGRSPWCDENVPAAAEDFFLGGNVYENSRDHQHLQQVSISQLQGTGSTNNRTYHCLHASRSSGTRHYTPADSEGIQVHADRGGCIFTIWIWSAAEGNWHCICAGRTEVIDAANWPCMGNLDSSCWMEDLNLRTRSEELV